MEDLTVIYITANKVPSDFAKTQRLTLTWAIGKYPLISVSREPLDFGLNIIDSEPMSYENIYRQMLRAAKFTKTPYVAIAEDDVFYSEEHFNFYRPPLDTFAYNQARLALFTWGIPIYSWRNRKSNCSLIAPRELLIESLEERFARWPNGMPKEYVGELGREMVEKGLRVTPRKSVEVFSSVPIIQLNHNGTEDRQKRRRKSLGPLKAYSIPYWGQAKDLVALYK